MLSKRIVGVLIGLAASLIVTQAQAGPPEGATVSTRLQLLNTGNVEGLENAEAIQRSVKSIVETSDAFEDMRNAVAALAATAGSATAEKLWYLDARIIVNLAQLKAVVGQALAMEGISTSNLNLFYQSPLIENVASEIFANPNIGAGQKRALLAFEREMEKKLFGDFLENLGGGRGRRKGNTSSVEIGTGADGEMVVIRSSADGAMTADSVLKEFLGEGIESGSGKSLETIAKDLQKNQNDIDAMKGIDDGSGEVIGGGDAQYGKGYEGTYVAEKGTFAKDKGKTVTIAFDHTSETSGGKTVDVYKVTVDGAPQGEMAEGTVGKWISNGEIVKPQGNVARPNPMSEETPTTRPPGIPDTVSPRAAEAAQSGAIGGASGAVRPAAGGVNSTTTPSAGPRWKGPKSDGGGFGPASRTGNDAAPSNEQEVKPAGHRIKKGAAAASEAKKEEKDKKAAPFKRNMYGPDGIKPMVEPK